MQRTWLTVLSRVLAGSLSIALGATFLAPPAFGLSPIKNPPCPAVSNQESGVRVLGFEFDGTASTHLRVNASNSSAVSTPQDLIGCYQTTEVVSRYEDALWQVGVIDRDSAGFFWKNAAGVSWRLSLDADQRAMTTGSDNPYFQFGKKFNFISLPQESTGPCKVRNATRNFGAGFTMQPTRYFGKSEVVFKVIVPRFRDEPRPHSPQATINGLDLAKVETFWTENSYGRMKLVLQPEQNVTIPGKAADYDDGPGAGEIKANRFMALSYGAFVEANPTAMFDGLIFAIPTEFDNFHAGYATSLGDLLKDRSLEKVGVSFIGSAPSRWGDPNAPPWKVVAHELGHNFGLPDYYITSKPGRSNMEWAGLTSGPFDIMAHLSANANELLAWNRWKVGWLKDEEVVCIDRLEQRRSIAVTPVASAVSGIKAVVFPQDAYSAVVVESRQAIGSDQGLMQDETGLLVYLVDSRIGSGDGPIRIIPRNNQYTSTTWSPSLPDKVRHLKAALRPGDRIQVGDLTLENSGKQGSDQLLVFRGPDTRQTVVVNSQFKSTYALSLKSIPVLIKSSSDAPILLTSETPDICEVSGARVLLKKPGVCFIVHEQGTNDGFFSATEIAYFNVVSSKTIICKKGPTVRKVVGAQPKCPSGFRLMR